MLTSIVTIKGVASEIDILVVKVIYLDKFLREQSSAVGLVKEKFLSNVAFWMIQRQPSKIEKTSWKQSFPFLVLILVTHSPGQCCLSVPPESNLILVKKSSKMQMIQILGGLKWVRGNFLIWLSKIHNFGRTWMLGWGITFP